MKINKLLFLFLIAALFCFASPVYAGLGISPSDWKEPNGMPGQQIKKTFTLSRSDTGGDLNFTSQITGDMTGWIKIENGNNFIMPKGQQQYPVNVTLSIPQNAEKKEYKGEIRLSSSLKAAQTGQVGVVLGALIRINLTVSDKQFLDYDILQIDIPQQETGDFISLILKIWNKGNVVAKPTKLTADIFDKFNTTKIDSQILADFSEIAGVAPFSQGQINLKIPAQLTPEQYWANVSVYQDDKVIKQEDITFSIVKAGTLKKPSSMPEENFENISFWWWLAGGTLLIMIVIVAAVIVARLLIKKKKIKKAKK